MANSPRLELELLEDRCTPAQFGVPWIDATHLTLSIAPDGTPAPSVASTLRAALDAQLPREVWRGAILRAVQTWSEVANVNIGIVNDDGSAFGSTGATQRDPRFGDIRIGGFPMSDEVLATAAPPPAFVAGTLAGDIFLNTNATFTEQSLFAVLLHELGHSLGLDEIDDPNAVMFAHLNNLTTLGASDLAAIQALYGARSPDPNEGSHGNDTLDDATHFKRPGGSLSKGATPLVAYGDLTTATDVDWYRVDVFSGYQGAVRFRLVTGGVSLLDARLTIFNEAGRQLGQASGSFNDGLTVTLSNLPAGHYYARVAAAPGAAFSVGRYGLATVFDANLHTLGRTVTSVLRGPYERVAPNDLATLFLRPEKVLFHADAHTNDRIGTATRLEPGPNQPSPPHLQALASLGDSSDRDFYRVKAPSSDGASWVLTVTVRAAARTGFLPRVSLWDGLGQRMPARILVNQDGTFTIQATVAEGGPYFARVHGNRPGNYTLDVFFGIVSSDVRTFVAGALPRPTSVAMHQLYIGQTQLLNLALTASGSGSVRLEIRNASGAVVWTLAAPAGDTVSGVRTLVPGAYTVRFSALNATGTTSYTLRGSGLSDPIGPVVDSTLLAPQYQAPSDPTLFLYPNGVLTIDPFLWILLFVR